MSDKMREDFSKHCQLWRYSEEIDENGFFTNTPTQRAWDVWAAAWQASRAALVVELPEVVDMYNEYTGDYCETYDCNEVKDALDKAGVKHEQR